MVNERFLEAERDRLRDATPNEVLRWAAETFPERVALATSLGAEDQALIHMLASHRLDEDIDVFMLDTGRLFYETHDLLAETQERYGLDIRLYFPDSRDVEAAVNENGVNYFRQSVDKRKHCCFIRKVKPLRRALAGRDAWITGLRREQSTTRQGAEVLEWDAGNGLYKINPLWNWSEERVWEFIRENGVPYNHLHDQGFPSIGCAPCTRAVQPGEDPRAGRWWWERPETKECGIHIEDGRVVRVRAHVA